jgi:hypothetical protein
MVRPFLLALAFILAPTVCLARESPEELLPQGTQVYLRWDGVEAHKASYAKTAMGKMMSGDTGKFLGAIFTLVNDNLGAVVTAEQLLKGTSPGRLMKMQTDAAQAPKLFDQIAKNGFIIAADVSNLDPVQAQLTLIIPNAADQPKPLFGVVGISAGLSGVEAKDEKINGTDVRHVQIEEVFINCFAAGEHLLLTIGTDKPAESVTRAKAKDSRLTSHPLFRRVSGFNQFETGARAFVDVASLVARAKSRGANVGKFLDDLGIEGLKDVVLYSGFDNDCDRGLIEAELPAERKGLVKMLVGQPFTLADAPPIPQDATSWSTTRFEVSSFYDVALATIENIVRLVSADDLPKVRELSKQADELLDVDLRNELFASLGDRFAMYSSPADGPFSLGQVFLFRVKDGPKLHGALNKAIKGLGRLSGMEINISKQEYHGADLRQISIRQQGFFFVPTFTVYKDWLAVSYFPQPVQGFVRRANGELPTWKPDERTEASLAKLPKEFVSVSVTDPRPTVRQVLSIGPLIAGLVKSFTPDLKLDVGSVPNTHEATRHLFPNVSVVTVKDNMLRVESRSSLDLPIDLSGIDTYGIFAILAFSRLLN